MEASEQSKEFNLSKTIVEMQQQSTRRRAQEYTDLVLTLTDLGIFHYKSQVSDDLNSHKRMMKSHPIKKVTDFFPISSAVCQERQDLYEFEIKQYCEFVRIFSLASLGIPPYKDFVDESMREIVKLTRKVSRVSDAGMFLLVCGFSVLSLKEETIEKVLMESVIQMEELYKLSRVPMTSYEYSYEFSSWLHVVKQILFKLATQGKVVKNENLSRHFVRFHLKLYKRFQKNTLVEAEKDCHVFKNVLAILQNSALLFKSQTIFLVKNFIRHWPGSYQYHEDAIDCLKWICGNLKEEEQEELKYVLMKKFNELLLHSEIKVFTIANAELTLLPESFIWFRECSEKEKELFEDNKVKFKVEDQPKTKAKSLKKNKCCTIL